MRLRRDLYQSEKRNLLYGNEKESGNQFEKAFDEEIRRNKEKTVVAREAQQRQAQREIDVFVRLNSIK